MAKDVLELVFNLTATLSGFFGIILNLPIAIILIGLIYQNKIPFRRYVLIANMNIANVFIGLVLLGPAFLAVTEKFYTDYHGTDGAVNSTPGIGDPSESASVHTYAAISSCLYFGSFTFAFSALIHAMAVGSPYTIHRNVGRGFLAFCVGVLWIVTLGLVTYMHIHNRWIAGNMPRVQSIIHYIMIVGYVVSPSAALALGVVCLFSAVKGWPKMITSGFGTKRATYTMIARVVLYCPPDIFSALAEAAAQYYRQQLNETMDTIAENPLDLANMENFKSFLEYFRTYLRYSQISKMVAMVRIVVEPILQLFTTENIGNVFKTNRPHVHDYRRSTTRRSRMEGWSERTRSQTESSSVEIVEVDKLILSNSESEPLSSDDRAEKLHVADTRF